MKYLVSVFVLGISLLASLPTLEISSKLEKAQEAAEERGDNAQLVLTTGQVEGLRIIVISALVALYVLPIWLVYALARGDDESEAPPAGMKVLPPADFTTTVDVSASEIDDDFTR